MRVTRADLLEAFHRLDIEEVLEDYRADRVELADAVEIILALVTEIAQRRRQANSEN